MNEHVKAETVTEEPIDPFTIRLSKPIVTHAGETNVLKLRPLTAGDFIDVNGLPFSMSADTKLDFKIALQWLARLSGVDELILRRLPHRDWMKAVASLNTILLSDGDLSGNSTG